MKRLSILSVILLFLFACEGDVGPMGPPGEPGKGMNWLILEYTLSPNEWVLEGEGVDALNSRWVAPCDVPNDIEGFNYKDAVIVVYFYPKGRDGFKTPLPYVNHYAVVEDGKEKPWTETFDYIIEEGLIYFYLSYSDFATSVEPAEEMEIDVVLLWE